MGLFKRHSEKPEPKVSFVTAVLDGMPLVVLDVDNPLFQTVAEPDPFNARKKIEQLGLLVEVEFGRVEIAKRPREGRQPQWVRFLEPRLLAAARDLPAEELQEALESSIDTALRTHKRERPTFRVVCLECRRPADVRLVRVFAGVLICAEATEGEVDKAPWLVKKTGRIGTCPECIHRAALR